MLVTEVLGVLIGCARDYFLHKAISCQFTCTYVCANWAIVGMGIGKDIPYRLSVRVTDRSSIIIDKKVWPKKYTWKQLAQTHYETLVPFGPNPKGKFGHLMDKMSWNL